MSNKELLLASEKGDFKSVKKLLSIKTIDINCQDILIKYFLLYSKIILLIMLFTILYRINY